MNSIFKRRSIRKYTSQEVSNEQIELILSAGMCAPSARNERPWHFIVVKEREQLIQLSQYSEYAKMLANAAAGIVICGDVTLQQTNGYIEIDCSAATQNMLLQITEMGLGAVWLAAYPRQERMAFIRKFFSLPENIEPFAVISLGYPQETKDSPDRFDKTRVHWEKW